MPGVGSYLKDTKSKLNDYSTSYREKRGGGINPLKKDAQAPLIASNARPLRSLQDPKSWAPPPKHTDGHGPLAAAQSISTGTYGQASVGQPAAPQAVPGQYAPQYGAPASNPAQYPPLAQPGQAPQYPQQYPMHYGQPLAYNPQFSQPTGYDQAPPPAQPIYGQPGTAPQAPSYTTTTPLASTAGIQLPQRPSVGTGPTLPSRAGSNASEPTPVPEETPKRPLADPKTFAPPPIPGMANPTASQVADRLENNRVPTPSFKVSTGLPYKAHPNPPARVEERDGGSQTPKITRKPPVAPARTLPALTQLPPEPAHAPSDEGIVNEPPPSYTVEGELDSTKPTSVKALAAQIAQLPTLAQGAGAAPASKPTPSLSTAAKPRLDPASASAAAARKKPPPARPTAAKPSLRSSVSPNTAAPVTPAPLPAQVPQSLPTATPRVVPSAPTSLTNTHAYTPMPAAASRVDEASQDSDLELHSQWYAVPAHELKLPVSLSGRSYSANTMMTASSTTLNLSVRQPTLSVLRLGLTWPNGNPSAVQVSRKETEPPRQMSPEELIAASGQFGEAVARWAEAQNGQRVGDGECWTLALHSIRDGTSGVAMTPQGYVHGALVLAQEGPTLVVAHEAMRRGDIVQLTSAVFSTGQTTGPHHTSVIVHVTGSLIYVLEQNVQGSAVQQGQYDLATLVSGKVEIFRVVRADWIEAL